MMKRNFSLILTVTMLALASAHAEVSADFRARQDYRSAHPDTAALRLRIELRKKIDAKLSQLEEATGKSPGRLRKVTASIQKATTPAIETSKDLISSRFEATYHWAGHAIDRGSDSIRVGYEKTKAFVSERLSESYGAVKNALTVALGAVKDYSNRQYQKVGALFTKKATPVLMLTNGDRPDAPAVPSSEAKSAAASSEVSAVSATIPEQEISVTSTTAPTSDQTVSIEKASKTEKQATTVPARETPLVLADGTINRDYIQTYYKMSLHEVRTLMSIDNHDDQSANGTKGVFSRLGVIKIGNIAGQEEQVVGLNVSGDPQKPRYFIFGNPGDEFTEDFHGINEYHHESSGFLDLLKLNNHYIWAKSPELNLATKLNPASSSADAAVSMSDELPAAQ